MFILAKEIRERDTLFNFDGMKDGETLHVLSIRIPGGTSIVLQVSSYKTATREIVIDAFTEVEVRRDTYGYSKVWVVTDKSIGDEYNSPPIYDGEAGSAYLSLEGGQYKGYIEADVDFLDGTLIVMADGKASYFFPHWRDSDCIAYLDGQHFEREGWGIEGHTQAYATERGGDYEKMFNLGVASINS